MPEYVVRSQGRMERIHDMYDHARQFIMLNARPIDKARWSFHFENGSADDVLEVLSAYQNKDGGFGHGLEPDCWNPESSPVQTWAATEIIREVGLADRNHPMIRSIIEYLSSGSDFDGHTWANTIPSNNSYPHAPWWTYTSDAETSYNPTACLAGFLVRFAEKDSSAYALGCRLARESYDYFLKQYPLDAMHTAACYVRLWEYLTKAGVADIIDMKQFRTLIREQIKSVITAATDKWASEYVCKPSLFMDKKDDEWYQDNRAIADFECDFLEKTQASDGTWAITWGWSEYPEEWHIAKNWWKCDLIIKNLKYYFGIRQ